MQTISQSFLQSVPIYPILERFKNELSKIYADQPFDLILFGSYAKGNFRADSDIDLLIVLPYFQSAFAEIDRLSELKYDFLLRYGIVISTITVRKQVFEQSQKSLFKNIKKEGVIL